MRPTTLIATLLPALLIVGVESPPRAHHATSQQATNVRNVSTTRPAPVAPPAARNHHTDVLRSAIVSQDSRAIHISDRAAVKQFNLVEPAGVIQLFRVTVPQGTRVSLTASIPHLAGIAMAAPQSSMPSQACTQRGHQERSASNSWSRDEIASLLAKRPEPLFARLLFSPPEQSPRRRTVGR
jgi:hypothetical protein